MRPAIRFLLSLSLFLALAGCAGRHTVSVDALGSPHTEKRYVVLPAAGFRPGDPILAECVRLVQGTLVSQGYTLADKDAADAAVLVSCHIGQVRGSIVGVEDEFGNTAPFWGPFEGSFVAVTAIRTGSASTRAVLLDAVELRREGPDKKPTYGARLWKLDLHNDNGEGSPRVLLTRMLEAGKPYIGADTHGIRQVDVPGGAGRAVYRSGSPE